MIALSALASLVILQMAPLQPAVPEGDVSLVALIALAALNPAMIAVAVWMGRQADQRAKLLIAAFAGAAAGIALIWLAALVKIPFVVGPARAGAGIFAASLIFGLAWAALGYALRRNSTTPPPPKA